MKPSAARIVLVTCGTRAQAHRIARHVVEAKLAACVNLVTAPVESVYRWKGKVERGLEFLLIIKTVASRLKHLEQVVKRLHSYGVPEFIVLPITSGSHEYLLWIAKATQL